MKANHNEKMPTDPRIQFSVEVEELREKRYIFKVTGPLYFLPLSYPLVVFILFFLFPLLFSRKGQSYIQEDKGS